MSSNLEKCRLVRIKLTLDAPEDLKYLKDGHGGAPALRRARPFRLAFEAVQEGGLPGTGRFRAAAVAISQRTVGRIIAEFRQQGIFTPTLQ